MKQKLQMVSKMDTAVKPETSPTFDYERAFSRNIGVVSREEQETLRRKHVAIPGCGGVGGIHALSLARAGIGRFTLADFDRYDVENFNRQFGAKASTVGLPKVEVMRREILEINPTAEVRIFSEGLTAQNLSDFLDGVDLVVDSLDFFAFAARDLLFPEAQRRGIPLMTAAPLGMSAALLLFTRDSMSYRDYFAFGENDLPLERALKLAIGVAPSGLHLKGMDPRSIDLKNGRGPSHVVGVTLCAAWVTARAVRLLTGRGAMAAVPHFEQFEASEGVFRRGHLWWGNRNPRQRLRLWLIRRFLGIKEITR